MSRHCNGKKIAGSHTTLIESAEVVVETAKKQKEVRKIALGMITVAKSQQKKLRFKPIMAGWEVIVHGTKALQALYVYTTDAQKTKLAIEEAFK